MPPVQAVGVRRTQHDANRLPVHPDRLRAAESEGIVERDDPAKVDPDHRPEGSELAVQQREVVQAVGRASGNEL